MNSALETTNASHATASTSSYNEQKYRQEKSKSTKVVPKFYYYLYCLNISNIKNQMSTLKRNHFTRGGDGDDNKYSVIRSRRF